jgi:hypothetical protein
MTEGSVGRDLRPSYTLGKAHEFVSDRPALTAGAPTHGADRGGIFAVAVI